MLELCIRNHLSKSMEIDGNGPLMEVCCQGNPLVQSHTGWAPAPLPSPSNMHDGVNYTIRARRQAALLEMPISASTNQFLLLGSRQSA